MPSVLSSFLHKLTHTRVSRSLSKCLLANGIDRTTVFQNVLHNHYSSSLLLFVVNLVRHLKRSESITHDQCFFLFLTAAFLIVLKRRRQFIVVARIRKSEQSVDPCHCLGRAHTPGITRGTPTTNQVSELGSKAEIDDKNGASPFLSLICALFSWKEEFYELQSCSKNR